MGAQGTSPAETEFPPTLEDLDKTIAAFDSIEQLLKSLYPETWKQDLDSIYAQTYIYYRSRAYYLSSKHNKGKVHRSQNVLRHLHCSELHIHSLIQAPVGKNKLVNYMGGCQWLYCRVCDCGVWLGNLKFRRKNQFNYVGKPFVAVEILCCVLEPHVTQHCTLAAG